MSDSLACVKLQESGPAEPPAFGDFDAATLHLPGDDPAATDQLLDTLWRRRQATLLAIGLWIRRAYPELERETRFDAAMNRYMLLPQSHRRALMEHPPFRVWLRLMARPFSLRGKAAAQVAVVRSRLADLQRLADDENVRPEERSGGRSYAIERYDVDPLIMEVAPPSYVFDQLDKKRSRDASSPYTLRFFADVVETALRRTEAVWPEMVAVLPKFVRTIIHVPDADHRSCSAERFAGAIMLSIADDTLLSVEESLIHECGHQVLYCIMELDPLVRKDAGGTFVLPWSGSKRDAYGYFHALYIYLLLGLFFERALGRYPTEDEAVHDRLIAILTGLKTALPDFDRAEFFTLGGRVFFDSLDDRATQLVERHRDALRS